MMIEFSEFKAQADDNDESVEQTIHEITTHRDNAYEKACKQIDQDEPVDQMPQCLSNALLLTSIFSYQNNMLDDYEEQYYSLSAIERLANDSTKDKLNRHILSLAPKLSGSNAAMIYLKLAGNTENSDEKQDHIQTALAYYEGITDPFQKAMIAVRLADHLPDQQATYLEVAENQIDNIKDPYLQATTMRMIVGYLSDEQKSATYDKMVEIVRGIDDDYFLATNLSSLGGLFGLPEEQTSALITEGFEIARSLTSVRPRLQALFYGIRAMEGDKRMAWEQHILDELDDLPSDYALLGVIQYYIRIMSGEHREALRERAMQIDDNFLRVRALVGFIADDQDPLIPELQCNVLDYFIDTSTRDRRILLSALARPEILSPTLWEANVLNDVVDSVIGICAEWQV